MYVFYFFFRLAEKKKILENRKEIFAFKSMRGTKDTAFSGKVAIMKYSFTVTLELRVREKKAEEK